MLTFWSIFGSYWHDSITQSLQICQLHIHVESSFHDIYWTNIPWLGRSFECCKLTVKFKIQCEMTWALWHGSLSSHGKMGTLWSYRDGHGQLQYLHQPCQGNIPHIITPLLLIQCMMDLYFKDVYTKFSPSIQTSQLTVILQSVQSNFGDPVLIVTSVSCS